jgi:Protein of unknown function (DUF2946)
MFVSQRPKLGKLDRPWAVWLALCLALLGALAPTVSHALVWVQGGQTPLIEVCTSDGPRWIALSNASEPVSNDPATEAALDHCPFCLLMADRMAPPPQPLPLSFAAPGQAGVSAPPPAVVLPAQVLAAAQPRGPPAF